MRRSPMRRRRGEGQGRGGGKAEGGIRKIVGGTTGKVMSNSSFDNLYVTPGVLAPGNAAIAQTSSDSRDFDDALQRAYQPADASDQVDPPPRDDGRDTTDGPSASDFGPSGSTMVRSSRRDSDNSNDSSHSQDRTSANDGARRSSGSEGSTAPQPKAKPRPTAHEKTKPADKPAAPAKKPQPTKSADRDAKQAAADAAASSDANEAAKSYQLKPKRQAKQPKPRPTQRRTHFLINFP